MDCFITPLAIFVEEFFSSWADNIKIDWRNLTTKIIKDAQVQAKAPKTSRNTKRGVLSKVQEKGLSGGGDSLVVTQGVSRKLLRTLKPEEFDRVSKETLKQDVISFLSMPHSSKIQKDFTDQFMLGAFEIKPISPFLIKLETWRRQNAWKHLQDEIFAERKLCFQK